MKGFFVKVPGVEVAHVVAGERFLLIEDGSLRIASADGLYVAAFKIWEAVYPILQEERAKKGVPILDPNEAVLN